MLEFHNSYRPCLTKLKVFYLYQVVLALAIEVADFSVDPSLFKALKVKTTAGVAGILAPHAASALRQSRQYYLITVADSGKTYLLLVPLRALARQTFRLFFPGRVYHSHQLGNIGVNGIVFELTRKTNVRMQISIFV